MVRGTTSANGLFSFRAISSLTRRPGPLDLMALSTDGHVLWERIETSWCWKCNKPTEHRVFFRWGYFAGRWTICNKCADIKVQRA
jgi:hypothetical protein